LKVGKLSLRTLIFKHRLNGGSIILIPIAIFVLGQIQAYLDFSYLRQRLGM
jgi:hypothetical protein